MSLYLFHNLSGKVAYLALMWRAGEGQCVREREYVSCTNTLRKAGGPFPWELPISPLLGH